MEIDYPTIGQRCVGTTRQGKRCRLPAYTIAGGLAVCPYHIKQAVELFREASSREGNGKFKSVFDKARDDSIYY